MYSMADIAVLKAVRGGLPHCSSHRSFVEPPDLLRVWIELGPGAPKAGKTWGP